MSEASRQYRLFGLVLDSAIALPELEEAGEGARPADVAIILGRVEGEAQPPGKPVRMAKTFEIPGVARYAVRDGQSIVVDVGEGVPAVNIRLYLLGTVMGILLHQRGMMPLHANCVVIGDRRIAFTGASGIGKSTLAAQFAAMGCEVLADDVCVLEPTEGGILVRPGVPRIRLWRDAIERLGKTPSSCSRSYAGDESWEKYDLPLSSLPTTAKEGFLHSIYWLERGQAFHVEALAGAAKLEALTSNTYRGAYLDTPGMRLRHLQTCLAIADALPIYRLSRLYDPACLAKDVEDIMRDVVAREKEMGSLVK